MHFHPALTCFCATATLLPMRPHSPPLPGQRLLCVGCYLGLAPLVRLFRSRFAHPLLRHHYLQAMAGFALFLVWFLGTLLFDATEWITFMYFPNFGVRPAWRVYVDYVPWLLFAGLVLMWLLLIGFAVAGSTRQIRFLHALTRRPAVVRLSLIVNTLVLAVIPIVALIALHGVSLTQKNRDGAAVYFLFDEGIPIPRTGYALGLYRLSLEAQRNWGAGSIVLDRLNKETLRTALAYGKVVIFATHGADGYAGTYCAPQTLCIGPPDAGDTNQINNSRFLRTCVLPDDYESWTRLKEGKWDQWENIDVNSGLRLMYIFGCDAGKKGWKEHLAPARVVTYDRTSSAFDHVLWFALTGPAELRKVR